MKEFNELVEIVSKLRTECPWDREQTHESLAKHLIEEAYELLDALAQFQIDSKNDSMLKDELGDLLLQILFATSKTSLTEYPFPYPQLKISDFLFLIIMFSPLVN